MLQGIILAVGFIIGGLAFLSLYPSEDQEPDLDHEQNGFSYSWQTLPQEKACSYCLTPFQDAGSGRCSYCGAPLPNEAN